MEPGIVLVTGGNSGIGFECARRLAREGRRVLIASRNREASEQAVQRIAREGGDRASALSLDLASSASTPAESPLAG
jgi:NAD(P)-dependent dehydrogenase (short-subunit alcohol dehydrogenase family)